MCFLRFVIFIDCEKKSLSSFEDEIAVEDKKDDCLWFFLAPFSKFDHQKYLFNIIGFFELLQQQLLLSD